ncbi:MAG: alpha/beta hydrolase [Moraxella sp.]|nr:alpha/beta hydrolase [Moraxella sp.]
MKTLILHRLSIFATFGLSLGATFGLSLGLSACQTISLPTSSARIIQTERSNILTHNQVSAGTLSILLSAGLTQESCMQAFDSCLTAVEQTFFGDTNQYKLATLAELHYAHSLHLRGRYACQPTIDRPPINPYYTNAPTPQDTQLDEQATRSDCLSSLRHALFGTLNHSYAYLFFDNLTQQPTPSHSPIISETNLRTQDLYHISINDIISEVYRQEQGAFAAVSIATHSLQANNIQQVHVSTIQSPIDDTDNHSNTLNLYLADDSYYLTHTQQGDAHALSNLISQYDTRLARLDVVSRRSGLGVGYVGSLNDRYTANVRNRISTSHTNDTTDQLYNADNPADRIHPTGHLLLTALIIPQGQTLDTVLSSRTHDAYFFNPYTTDTVSIFGNDYPLSANFSAGYALWLSENELRQLAFLNLIAKKDAYLPELFMLEPYNPNKKVVIMLHGLASSPRTWVNLTNNLLTDPVLRENYQVWQVFYATNLPILENRYQIQRLIETAYTTTDPTGDNPASHDSVLIGHSMGGLIARLMLSNDDLSAKLSTLDSHDSKRLLQGMSVQGVNTDTPTHSSVQEQLAIIQDSDIATEFSERLTLHPVPQVSTAVFVSSPFRGTDYADRWFTRAARRIIHLPANLTQAVTNTLGNLGDTIIGGLYLQNGASQLSNQSSFMKLTSDVQIDDKVSYHSIMANNTSTDTKIAQAAGDTISDGIVPYTSSHLGGVSSERILHGGHSIHESPETILHLRQILHDHLSAHPNDAIVD